jgi:hypothetical protein
MKTENGKEDASGRSALSVRLGVDWSAERKLLEKVAKGKIVITERMTVAEIEERLKPFSADLSVATALRELECQKKRAEGLAQHQELRGTQDIHKLPLLSRVVYVARRHLVLLLQDVKLVFRTSDISHQCSCVSPNVK